jgi:hypothetical protein
MQASIRNTPPRWFWLAAAAAILWNLIGVVAYIMDVTMSAETLATLPAAERELYESEPVWVTGVYAIAVFAGLAGSILLALRKSAALPVLALSLVAVLVQMLHTFALSDTLAVLGPSGIALPAVIVVIGAALVWLALHARRAGWP